MTLILLALAELGAIASAGAWGAPGWFGGMAVLAGAPAVGAVWGRRAGTWAVVAAVLALTGGMRFAAWEERPAPGLAAFTGRTITIEGEVVSEAEPGTATARYRVDARRFADGAPIDGGVLMTLSEYARHEPGELVRVRGELEEAPVFDDFDYRGYLARRGIVGTMYQPRVEVLSTPGRWERARLLAAARSRLDRAMQRALPEPEASLGSGIAFGRDGTISTGLYDDFRATGLAHIVAVSGSNVALAAMVAFTVFVPVIGRRWAVLPALALVGSYVAVAGGSGSVVRAGVMVGVLLAATWLGRPGSALAALAATVIGLTLAWPRLAVDAGFQLSLSATAGIIVFAPWFAWAIRSGLRKVRLEGGVPALVVEGLSLTLAATIATLPVSVVTFGQVSLIGPLANAITAPLFVVAFPLAVVTALAGIAWDPAGWVLGLVAYYPLAATVWIAEHFADVPFASVSVRPLSPRLACAVAAIAMALAGWPAYRYLAPDVRPAGLWKRGRLPALAATGALALFTVWMVSLRSMGGPGVLQIDVLDVGQGDAILITTPAGRHVLVDGGPSGIQLARELGAVLPHWERELDATVLTHPDLDHVSGLVAALDRYDVAVAMRSEATGTTLNAAAYHRREGSPRVLHRGGWWVMDGVRFEVLWPPAGFESKQANDLSVVLRVTYGETVALLTGDFEAAAQRELMAEDDVRAEVLKVPHHGSKTSSKAFLAAVGARVAVVSVGVGNQHGHPVQEILDMLAGSELRRTDLDGRVRIESNGRAVTVTTTK